MLVGKFGELNGMWDPTEMRRMAAKVAALEITYTYNGAEKVYEFGNPGLEV